MNYIITLETQRRTLQIDDNVKVTGERYIDISPTLLIPLSSLSPKARSSITQSNILIIQPGTNYLPVHYPFVSKGESESRITNLLEFVDGGGLHAEDQLKNRSG